MFQLVDTFAKQQIGKELVKYIAAHPLLSCLEIILNPYGL